MYEKHLQLFCIKGRSLFLCSMRWPLVLVGVKWAPLDEQGLKRIGVGLFTCLAEEVLAAWDRVGVEGLMSGKKTKPLVRST